MTKRIPVFLALVILALYLVRLAAQSPAAAIVPVPPPPNPLPKLSPPPSQPIVRPLPRPDVAEIQRLTPRVEIWRANAQRAQVPARRSEVMDNAYVTGTEPVMVRLQFDPGMAGERITVIGARGVSLNPPQQMVAVSSRGDCTIPVQLAPGAPRGHLVIYCKMIRTVVPLTRASLAIIQAEETRTGGRP